jgi:hypothetical protein
MINGSDFCIYCNLENDLYIAWKKLDLGILDPEEHVP